MTMKEGRFAMKNFTVVCIALALLLGISIYGLGIQAGGKHSSKTKEDSVAEHLRMFDELDFDVYSNQKWDRLSETHADDILVTYPDGHETRGLKSHIEELKPLFVFAPDTKIKVHPIKFGSGEWTCVTGIITGTFSQPMPAGNAKTIPPTGRAFTLNMATVGHWKNGKMIEESLFWDNQDLMKQIGLEQ
jgi:hypothetical protein